MPMYEFEDADGKVEEHFFEMAKAPSIGKSITRKGRKLTRIVSGERLQVHVDNTCFLAWSQPLWAEGADGYGAKGTPEEGVPIFGKKHNAKEYAKRNGGTYGEREDWPTEKQR